jgi:two-component system NtrC family response regulator
VHEASPRRKGPFVAVDCGALPDSLLESELFGHVRGAFTGAVRDKMGKFELAAGGTLFLDEIGSMPVQLQSKLLRALQEREVERIGDEKTIPVDVRIVAATNRALPALIAEGAFREDLYYRLNVVPVRLPALRERTGDIPLLAKHFIAQFARDARVSITRGALDLLASYRWPGNVRELENFCERIVLMRTGSSVDEALVGHHLAALAGDAVPVTATLREIERAAVVDALRSSGWNQSRAARRLGVPRHILLYRMKKFDIRPEG